MKVKVTFDNGEHMIFDSKEVSKIFKEDAKITIEPLKYVRSADARKQNAGFKALIGAIEANNSMDYIDYVETIRKTEGQL